MKCYIHEAIRIGMNEICFLDHLTLNEKGKKYSMALREVPLYFQAVQNMKNLYHDQINIRAGLEIDFHPETLSLAEDIIGKFAFDAIGGSIHFVNNVNIASRRESQKIKKTELDDLVQNYFERLLTMLDHDYYDFICHLDIIKKTGLMNVSNSNDYLIDTVLSKIADKNIPVEINSSGWGHPVKAPYPSKTLLRQCFDKNIPLVMGSDAHHPEQIGKFYNKTLGIVASSGYTEVCVFRKRVRHTIKI